MLFLNNWKQVWTPFFMVIFLSSLPLLYPLNASNFILPSSSGISKERIFEARLPSMLYVLKNETLEEDPLLLDYLKDLIQKAGRYSKQPLPVSILFVANKTTNAFAMPGALIAINEGLFSKAQNEGELFSVLAHEVGHLRGQHAFRTQSFSSNDALFSILLGLSGSGIPMILAGIASATEKRLHYGREMEREADAIGANIMTQEHYNLRDAITFFNRMREEEGSSSAPNFLQTHPLSLERMSNLASRLAQQPKMPKTNNQRFNRVKSFFLSQSIRLEKPPKEASSYLKALYYLQKKQCTKKSLDFAKEALKKTPLSLESMTLENKLALCMKNANLPSILSRLDNELLLYPNSLSLNLLYHELAVRLSNPTILKKSTKHLVSLTKSYPFYLVLWKALLLEGSLQDDKFLSKLSILYIHLFHLDLTSVNVILERLKKQKNTKNIPLLAPLFQERPFIPFEFITFHNLKLESSQKPLKQPSLP